MHGEGVRGGGGGHTHRSLTPPHLQSDVQAYFFGALEEVTAAANLHNTAF